ncbi:MAG: 3'-5' exonuclease [Candidatus Melainabacteria bacterium]|nr:3'-5' exonuclease [Candidatus Melainabacteria bacterium]
MIDETTLQGAVASWGKPSNAEGPEAMIVLDTETTGLDHRTEKIVEIAAVRMVNREIVATFSELVNPQQHIRTSSYKIHNISEEMVENAPTIEEVLPRFLAFVGDLPFAAHNAIFDYSFINEACKAVLGERFQNHRVDTFDMYKSVFPDEPSHGLAALLHRFGHEPTVQHRALDDAMNLAKVYYPLRELYIQKQAWKFAQLDNIEYLVERYLRLQRSVQVLQAEMSDLKEIFKLHFLEGGKPVNATSGEMMVSTVRRSYDYDDSKVLPIIRELDMIHKTYKLNVRAVDKMVDGRMGVSDEVRQQLKDARTSMHENRTITFIKPQSSNEHGGAATAAEEATEPGEDAESSPHAPADGSQAGSSAHQTVG